MSDRFFSYINQSERFFIVDWTGRGFLWFVAGRKFAPSQRHKSIMLRIITGEISLTYICVRFLKGIG